MPEAKEKEADDDGVVKPGPNERSREVATFWKEQSDQVGGTYKDWHTFCKSMIARFRDERTKDNVDGGMRRMNVIWPNFKIMKPAIFSKTPLPIIERKFLDRDPVARLSAQILERAERNEIEENGFYGSVSRAVSDYLLPGRGVVWVRYEPEIGQGDSLPSTYQNSFEDDLAEATEGEKNTQGSEVRATPLNKNSKEKTEKLMDTGEQLLNESAPVDYVDYRDFKMFPAKVRTWAEVQAISKKVTMSKRQCIDRFGSKIGKAMKPDATYQDKTESGPISNAQRAYQDINEKNIVVEEVWNKVDRRIYWFSTGYEYLCDVKDDFLELKDFFPVPEPISATLTNDTMVPIPDYKEYQDQAIQIDELTQRIAFLTKACKVAGCYAAESDPLKRLLDEGFENQLIAVEDWTGLTESGGLEGLIYFLPIDKIQAVIETLTKVRQQVMTDMDMMTGISDVIRGTTDSRETLGGIRLKNNNAGTRLSDRQNEVARFAKDTIAIVAEIMAKHFSDETLIEKSGVKYMDEMQPEYVIAELKAGKDKDKQMRSPIQKPAPSIGGAGNPMAGQGGGLPGAPGSSVAPPMAGAPPGQPPMPQSPGGPPAAPKPPMPMGGGLMPPGQGQGQEETPEVKAMRERIEELQLKEKADEIIAEKLEKALELLRENITFYYRIDIESDSTIFGDAQQEKENATEFLTAVTTFMKEAATVVQTMPKAMPLMGRMLQWGVRKFRTGRDLESAIDSFIVSMEAMVKDQEENPKPNPEEMKAQADLAIKQQEMEHQKQLQLMEQQSQQANDQRDVMKAQMEDQRQKELNAMEMQAAQQKAQLEREKMELEKQLMLLKHQLETQKMQMESQHQERSMQMEQAHQQQTMQLKSAEAQQQHQLAMSQAEQQNTLAQQKHTQSMEAQTQKHKLGMEANQQKHTMMKEQASIKAKQPKSKKAA